MNKHRRYSPEIRERVVRMVIENGHEYTSQWLAIVSIAGKIGCTPETLCEWVRRMEVGTDRRIDVDVCHRSLAVMGIASDK